VDEFLSRVATFCDTYIFTSATRDYATPVIELLDPLQTKFRGVYTREYTTKTNFISGPVHVKDLTAIMRTPNFQQNLRPMLSMTQLLARVVLVDNNPLSFIPQPSNGILVKNFYHDCQDTALSQVWDMICDLQRVPDVRVSLKPLFRMEETLTSLQAQQHQTHQVHQVQVQQREVMPVEVQQNLVQQQSLGQPHSPHQQLMQQQQLQLQWAGAASATKRPSITTPPPPSTNAAVVQLEGELLAAIEMQDLEQQQVTDLDAATPPSQMNGATGKRKLL
jgi:hypothetical protein